MEKKRLTRRTFDEPVPDLYELGSEFEFAADTSSSCTSSSTFQYINSQLIAHGFTASPGIALDGISDETMDSVTKCLFAMLSQRVNDMSQAEELSTKLRTLSYDHERLINMHRVSTEKALNAEREVNMYKSRLATAARSLQSSESNHKQTSAELQRTRTSLQALRATHVAELKKREKEIERMVEKWTKLADSQAKPSSASLGLVIRGANAEVATGMESLGKGKGYLEVALEHAESSRTELLDETTRLRRLILVAANRLQSMLHQIRILASVKSEEPASFDHDALFPITPINAADDKILSLFASANETISVLSKHLSDRLNIVQAVASEQTVEANAEDRGLQAVIEKLQAELDEAKKQHETHAAETCDLLDQLAAQGMRRASTDNLLIASERDVERDRLDRIREELEDERVRFTQATIRLSEEKSAFESERIRFLEERQSWQAQKILSEQPPSASPKTELAGTDLPSPSLAAHLPEVKKSPRKSPRKQKVVGKSGNSRKTRVSRRSSVFSIPPPANFEPAYETEVIPIVLPASEESSQPSNNKSSTLTKSILPTSFVLPPPSPRTSLPPPDSLLGPLDGHIPDDDPNPTESLSPPSSPPFCPIPIPTITEPSPIPMEKPAQGIPQTPPPLRRPFPMAKPLAPHMTHAYSPVKPSPLSRILMLADSPESPESGPLPNSDGKDTTPTGSAPVPPEPAVVGMMAARDDLNDNPLRERKTERNAVKVKKSDKTEPKKRATKERGKSKEEPIVPPAAGKPKIVGAGEKENRDKPSRRGSPPMSGGPPTKPPTTSTSKPDAPVKSMNKMPPKLPVGRGGARRVPIGSAEAAPLPGWRG